MSSYCFQKGILAMIFVIRSVPETKGKSLEEIEHTFHAYEKRYFLKKARNCLNGNIPIRTTRLLPNIIH
ncbi:hypothetical protein EWI07_14280 [Sporolactobacillus sp. THM7-4]|nr:hypothetical protein EWI07_14280 [Sporolactobacillus sp. THM7-4]